MAALLAMELNVTVLLLQPPPELEPLDVKTPWVRHSISDTQEANVMQRFSVPTLADFLQWHGSQFSSPSSSVSSKPECCLIWLLLSSDS